MSKATFEDARLTQGDQGWQLSIKYSPLDQAPQLAPAAEVALMCIIQRLDPDAPAYSATCPELGLNSNGTSPGDAFANLRQDIRSIYQAGGEAALDQRFRQQAERVLKFKMSLLTDE